MTRKRPRPFFSILTSFFNVRLNRVVMGISIIICLVLLIYFLNLKAVIVFPSDQKYRFTFFTDTANQGSSTINEYLIDDSVIRMDYTLRKGFVDPYVSISISHKQDSLINLKYYNRVLIDLQGYNTENIGFDIFIPFALKEGGFISFYDNILEIEPGRKVYKLNLKNLKIPDYWYVANDISPDQRIKPDLSRVSHFNIGTAYTNNFDINRSLKIHALRFERNNTNLFLILLLFELAITGLLIIISYRRNYKIAGQKTISVSYKPVETENDNTEEEINFLNYINHHYSDAEISLEKMADDVRIHKRTISAKIQATYGCNFKTHLNNLRIHESKRLLRETNLNMGEIADKVGFNTQSHFNRVFKSIEGINPTDFKNIDS